MLAVLLEGWQRAGGVPPVYMGWIIFRYCREKYGKNSAQKNKKDSNTTSEPIVAGRFFDNRSNGQRITLQSGLFMLFAWGSVNPVLCRFTSWRLRRCAWMFRCRSSTRAAR